MFLFKRIKASSLQMVLVVSVVILLLLLSFILFVYVQKRIGVKYSNFKESVYLNHQVFDYLKNNDVPYGNKNSIDFFNSENQYVTIVKKQWGIFELFGVTTKVGKEVFHKNALVGYTTKNRNALYLSDKFQPLIVVGNTTIRGNALLPSRGVNSGNIAGVSYNKSQFIYGEIFQSESTLPRLFHKEKIQEFLSTYTRDTITNFNLDITEQLDNSFHKKTNVFQKNGAIHLSEVSLKGNIIIESDTLIKIDASAKLEDVILIAPKVEITQGFKGNVQVFATKTITISSNCLLNYPTSLIVFDTSEDATIKISEASIVKGIVGHFKQNSEKTNYKSSVLLDKNATLFGELYSMGNVELLGTVNGSVYANSFIANQFGSIYINHIYNGTIDAEKLPKQYAGLSMQNGIKNVAKWLD
ncbi:MAG: hypothetical protein HWD85_00020 [Flavobacteriaceae bacterium]|nr:hypothetical protein [Flavobacteriaceae bacterium]